MGESMLTIWKLSVRSCCLAVQRQMLETSRGRWFQFAPVGAGTLEPSPMSACVYCNLFTATGARPRPRNSSANEVLGLLVPSHEPLGAWFLISQSAPKANQSL